MGSEKALRILHIIEQLRLGGPLYALTGAKKNSRLPQGSRHVIISLLPPDRRACALAAEAGIAVTWQPEVQALRHEMADADIVQVHFWNSPEIHALMSAQLPAMRVLVWCHVNGAAAPHILPRSLFTFGDMVAATTASTLDLPAFRAADPARVALAPGGADFSRLEGLQPVAHDGFNVGYVGLVDFAKLHPTFIRMSAAVNVPSVRFLIGGAGDARRDLERQARDLGEKDRFVFHDYAEDIRPVLSQLDVFGYPLRADNSSTSELVLQETMFAGVPPIVFPHGGAASLVTDGRNGIVARNEADYVTAVERLFHDPQERQRLGENAASDARKHFGAQACGRQLDALYDRLMDQPKRLRPRIVAESIPDVARKSLGAWALIRSLDGTGDADFLASLTAPREGDAIEAEERIAGASPNMHDLVLQYRVRHPTDPHLRLWAGLVLAQKSRKGLAAAEFKASLMLGCDHPRVHRYLAESARVAGPDIASPAPRSDHTAGQRAATGT